MIVPEELLSSILTFLPQSQLASIARVCKRFYQIIQPLLFKSIELHARSEVLHRDAKLAQYQSCHLLCRSIQERPPFASLVRKLTMEGRNPSILVEDCSTSEAQNLVFPNLTMLILRHAQMRGSTFQKVLAMTPRLEVLDCSFECDADPHDQYHAMFLDCGELGAALQSLARTVVQLKISVEFVTSAALEIDNGGSYEGHDPWGIKGRLGASLKGFHALKGLDVPWSVLLGWLNHSRMALSECLPDALQTLVLAHDLGFFVNYEWNDEAVCVSSLIEYLETPSLGAALRSLKLRFNGDYEDEERPTLDRNLWVKLYKKCKEIDCHLQLEGRDL